MTKRDNHIDNAKGLLMMLVVLGHLIYPVPTPDMASNVLYVFIYLFHMPMFALVSGYLSHPEMDLARTFKDARLLLVPYVIFTAAQWAILTLTGQQTMALHEGHFGLWFLLSLFCWRTALPVITRLPYSLAIVIVLSLACGFVPQIGLGFSLSRTITLMPFFLAGHLMRTRGARLDGVMNKPVAVAVLCLAVLVSIPLAHWNAQALLFGSYSYQRLGLPYAMGPGIRAMSLVLSFCCGLAFMALVPKRPGLFTRIGRYSLYVYLLHSPLLVLYRTWPGNYEFLGQQPLIMIPVAILISLVLASEPVTRSTRMLVSPLGKPK